MRKLALLAVVALLAGIGPDAFAAKRVTVEQLEQMLAANRGKGDARVAGQLSGLERTERASSFRLARWTSDFPGPRCRVALTVLADASAFLDLPATDIPATAAPEVTEQEQILARVNDYVSKTMDRLPNFMATRNTIYFEETPSQQQIGQATWTLSVTTSEYKPLHVVGRSTMPVSYLNGNEVVDAKAGKGKSKGSEAPPNQLASVGEFGPILAVVLGDSAGSKMIWSHWEQGAMVVEAVFHYSVSQENSHYTVASPLKGAAPQFPAYQGEIAVDPETGSILRLTLVAGAKQGNVGVDADILVEYGPVMIGANSYIWPVRAVAMSKVPIMNDLGSLAGTKTELNDVLFTQYHVFRAESRIVPVEESEEP